MSTQTTGTEARRHEGCSFKSILREVRGNQVKRPGSLFLVEFYTRRGLIHFAWIYNAANMAEARQRVALVRGFREIIQITRHAEVIELLIGNPADCVVHHVGRGS